MAGPSYTHAQLEELWILSGGDRSYADTAAAIAEAESGGCQYAKAGPTDDRPVKACTYRYTTKENSYGLWQINRNAHPQYSAASLYTELGNANAAVEVSNGGTNFQPWSTYVNGAYRNYLQSAGTPGPQPGTVSTPTTGVRPAEALGGYADLRNSLSKHLPIQLERSRRQGAATLRLLGRSHRVKG